MGRKQKTIHYLYKTTCSINGKYYIGMHSTSKFNDGYLGSGKRLRYSIRKYGKENHIKEIIMFFDSRELLIEGEKQIVNLFLLNDHNCLNLCIGGEGGRGFTSEEQKNNALKSNLKQKELRKNKEWVEKKSKQLSSSLKKIYENGEREKKQPLNWVGRKHKKETIEKLKGHKRQVGVLNSQFGTCWVTNGIENKKINKEKFIEFENLGWKKGMTPNPNSIKNLKINWKSKV